VCTGSFACTPLVIVNVGFLGIEPFYSPAMDLEGGARVHSANDTWSQNII